MSGRITIAVFLAALLGIGTWACNSKQPAESAPGEVASHQEFAAGEGSGEAPKGHRPPPPDGKRRRGEGPPHMKGKEPPAEAVEACKDKAEGDACEAQMGDKKMEGECKKGPGAEDSTLACMPKPPKKD